MDYVWALLCSYNFQALSLRNSYLNKSVSILLFIYLFGKKVSGYKILRRSPLLPAHKMGRYIFAADHYEYLPI